MVTVEVVEMVLSGLVNKRIVQAINAEGGSAVRQWPLEIVDGYASIPAGHIHGIEDGMTLGIYESPTDPDSAALGEMVGDFAESFRAELAQVDLSVYDIPRGAYARLSEGTIRFGLSVALPGGNSETVQKLQDALRVGAHKFGSRIVFVPANADADLILAEQGGAGAQGNLAVLPSTGILMDAAIRMTPVIRTTDKSSEDLADALADTLNRIARVQNLLKLGSAFASDALQVDVQLQTRSPTKHRLSALETVPVPELVPDDEVHTLVRNHEDFPIDLNVLYVGSNYSITHIFSGRLQPRDRLKQGLFRITDEGFGRDRVLIMLTPAERGKAVEDLSFLAQDELPSTRAFGSRFHALMMEAGFGSTTRAATPLSNSSDGPSPALLVYDIDTVPGH